MRGTCSLCYQEKEGDVPAWLADLPDPPFLCFEDQRYLHDLLEARDHPLAPGHARSLALAYLYHLGFLGLKPDN